MNETKSLILAAAIACGVAVTPTWAKQRHDAPPAQRAAQAETLSLSGAEATVAFSPNGDVTNVIVKAINSARKQVLVQAYGFTSAPIIKALADARARGIDVEAILDKSNRSGRYSGATYLVNHHIPVWIDDSVAIAHSKVMIIDGSAVITGSFNFTQAAQSKNAENVLLITNAPALAREYSKNWHWRQELSHGYD